jgi:hypothetical protein
MEEDKIRVYIHVATIGNYQEVFDEIFGSLLLSGLISDADKIFISVVGAGQLEYPNYPNISYSQLPEVSVGEFHTLDKIKTYSDSFDGNTKILYVHTKGVTTPRNQSIMDWRNYMVYFNIIKYKDAINILNEYDTSGVDLVDEPTTHYSGNFWWANSSFIKKLPPIEEISNQNAKVILTLRHNAEFWIGMVDGKRNSMHNSNINVYERHLHNYPKSNYIKNENI